MRFREWLQFDEVRFKGLYRQFRGANPDIPDYVARDLYHNRVGADMRNTLFPNLPHEAPTVGVKNNGYTRTSQSPTPNDLPNKLMQRAGLENIRWLPKPLVIRVSPSDFDNNTQEYFLYRRFGYITDPGVRDDAMRTMRQRQQAAIKPSGANEPIIVIWDGSRYKLLEGWHRTMNYLVSPHAAHLGAPPDQMRILRDGNLNDLDFSRWQKVGLLAYVGVLGNSPGPTGAGSPQRAYTRPQAA